MKEALNVAGRARRPQPDLAIGELFDVNPFARFDPQMLLQILLQRDLTFSCDPK